MELSRAAIALLWFYIREGPPATPRSAIEEMKGAGIPDRTRFFKARDELERAGYIHYKRDGKRGTLTLDVGLLRTLSTSIVGWYGVVEGVDGMGLDLIYLSNLGITQSGSTSGLNGRANHEVLNTNTSEVLNNNTSEVWETNTSPSEVWETNTSGGIDDVLNINTTQTEVLNTNTSENHEVLDTNTSLLARCMAADEMDGSGAKNSRDTTTPYHTRRTAQLRLVKEAFREFFPEHGISLGDRDAGQFLGWCEGSAVMCYQDLEEIARSGHKKGPLSSPPAYVKSALKRRFEEGRTGDRPRRPASTTSVVGLGDVWDGEYIPITDEYREKARKAKQQARERFGDDL